MKLKDTLDKLSNISINDEFIAQLEAIYTRAFSEEVKRIVSISDGTVFYEDFSILRGLSDQEIIDAPSDMAVDFIGLGLLPVFDIGDNDYIVYDVKEQAWYKFNIVDEIKFSKVSNIIEYLL